MGWNDRVQIPGLLPNIIKGDCMWILVISLFSTTPGLPTSSGSITAKYPDYESCMRAREQAVRTIKIENYRTGAGCVPFK
jgi:hypothetical protein